MHKEAAWLLGELQDLVGRGVLDDAAAARLRAHYAQAATPQGFGWGMILLAIGGAALVGLGVILIFAHNWENWTPEVRVALSLAPLLFGQIAAFHALRSGSRLWCEGAGLFTGLAIGASIALIAQTYQFGGDLPRFILTWTLLALPLVYLLDSSAVAALCWLGVLGWAVVSPHEGWWGESAQDALRLPAFLLLASLPLPHLMRHIRLDRASSRVAWLLRVLLLVLVAGLAAVLVRRHFDELLFVYASMAASAALAGRLYFSGTQGLWGNPLQGAGSLGVLVIALLMTVREIWPEVEVPRSTLLLIPCALGLLAFWLAVQLARREGRLLPFVFAALTPTLFLLDALAPLQPGLVSALGHAYALVVAAALIRTGLHQGRLGLANQGAGLVAAVILLRFFNDDLSYVVRGIGFIVTGAGFFAANVWLRRRVRGAA
jgi:uncharacterized membrane protein